jgi:hypothetical protein
VPVLFRITHRSARHQHMCFIAPWFHRPLYKHPGLHRLREPDDRLQSKKHKGLVTAHGLLGIAQQVTRGCFVGSLGGFAPPPPEKVNFRHWAFPPPPPPLDIKFQNGGNNFIWRQQTWK